VKQRTSFRSPSLFDLLVHSWCRGFLFSLDYTQTHSTVGRTPLDEGLARCRDLYLTTQTLDKRQTSIPPVGFEPMLPVSALPQTYAWGRAATGTGSREHTWGIGNDGRMRYWDVIRVIKSRRMRWAGYVESMRENRNADRVLARKTVGREKADWGRLDVDWMRILNWLWTNIIWKYIWVHGTHNRGQLCARVIGESVSAGSIWDVQFVDY
jgi:hypothetical protein